jgi:hypothetical protein
LSSALDLAIGWVDEDAPCPTCPSMAMDGDEEHAAGCRFVEICKLAGEKAQ